VYECGIYNFASLKKIQVRFLLHIKLSVKFFTFVHGLSHEAVTGKNMLKCFLLSDDIVANHLLVVCPRTSFYSVCSPTLRFLSLRFFFLRFLVTPTSARVVATHVWFSGTCKSWYDSPFTDVFPHSFSRGFPEVFFIHYNVLNCLSSKGYKPSASLGSAEKYSTALFDNTWLFLSRLYGCETAFCQKTLGRGSALVRCSVLSLAMLRQGDTKNRRQNKNLAIILILIVTP
jgi:hypothetical protein